MDGTPDRVDRTPSRSVRVMGSPTPEEAAAIVAAVERFLREHAPAPTGHAADPWTRAARLEGAHADGRRVGPAAWGDPHPWG